MAALRHLFSYCIPFLLQSQSHSGFVTGGKTATLCSLPYSTAELSMSFKQSDCPEQNDSFFLCIKHFTPEVEVVIAEKIAA